MFDLDGTLIDSKPEIEDAFRKTFSDVPASYIETPSRHTINLPSRDFYRQKGFPCTTINFKDDHTHVETVDLDEVGDMQVDSVWLFSKKDFAGPHFWKISFYHLDLSIMMGK